MNTTISQASVWGETWQREAHTAPRSDNDVRESYNAKVSEAYQAFVKTAAEFHDNEQCFGHEVAREAFATRNTIKEAHQAETSLIGRVGIWVRNLVMYGAGNANYEGLSRKKNPEEIAYSAFKTDGSDLGLAGNGFGDILKTWNAIKDISTIYPEAITPAMVAVFKAQPAGKIDAVAILAAYRAIEKADQQPVQKSVDQVVHSDEVPVARTQMCSKDELLATLGHAPRRSYSYI